MMPGGIGQEYTLKRLPSDFQVSEVLIPRAVEKSISSFHYIKLFKRGYTTFQATDLVAKSLNLPSSSIGYAGLKDEDAITEQYFSMPRPVTSTEIASFNSENAPVDESSQTPFIRLQHHSYSDYGLEPGALDGNSFRIVVRGIHGNAAARLRQLQSRFNLFFVNYYDTQRFGVPGGPKQTHLIGAAISARDYETAFTLLERSGSAEAALCVNHKGSAEEFFANIEQRRVAFYLSANSSDKWNKQVGQRLQEIDASNLVEISRDGIKYVISPTNEVVLRFLAQGSGLEYLNYRWRNGSMQSYLSQRPVVTQTQVRVTRVQPDELVPDRWQCELLFFLSSGCYATMAVTQFMHQINC